MTIPSTSFHLANRPLSPLATILSEISSKLKLDLFNSTVGIQTLIASTSLAFAYAANARISINNTCLLPLKISSSRGVMAVIFGGGASEVRRGGNWERDFRLESAVTGNWWVARIGDGVVG